MKANPSTRSRAKQLLEAGRKDDPIRYDVAVGLARHRHLVAVGVALPAWAAIGSAKALGAALATKVIIGTVVVASVGASIWAYPGADRRIPVNAKAAQAEDPRAAIRPPIPIRPAPSAIPLDSLPSADRAATAPSLPAPSTPPASASSPPALDVRLGEDIPTPTPSAKPRTDPSLEEVRVVAEAERLLESDPARALAMTRSLDERLPGGYLAHERRYITST
jgi:hypothetical protein